MCVIELDCRLGRALVKPSIHHTEEVNRSHGQYGEDQEKGTGSSPTSATVYCQVPPSRETKC